MLTPAKRRALAAAVTALLAVALAAAVAGRGCSSEDDTPEGAVRAFVAAARAGDHEALFELLGPATRARLERSAVHLGILTGEGRPASPSELIRVDAERGGPVDVQVLSERGDRAVVRVRGDEEEGRLELVRVDGHWRIELPGRAGEPRAPQ